MKQSEIDRALVLFYRSNNAHDEVNFTRTADWLDKLPMSGLDELANLLEAMRRDVNDEIQRRHVDNIPVYSRLYHQSQIEERNAVKR